MKSAVLILISLLVGTTSSYRIGDKIDDFKLKNTDGTWKSLQDYQNQKGVILIFDCNTCPYSKAYNERIIALHKDFAPQGFPVVTINSNAAEISPGDSFEEMVKEARRKKYAFHYLHDADQSIGHRFGATNTPQVFLLQKQSQDFILVYKGAIDNNVKDANNASRHFVREALEALIAGKTVAQSETKAIGCGIKYR